MPIIVSLFDFFADSSTNAMGTETRIKELVALINDTQDGIILDGKFCKNEDDIRKVLIKRGKILDGKGGAQ